MKFAGVVGNRSAGKSTIIASLGGLPLHGPRELQFVEDVKTGNRLYSINSSPEESGLKLADVKRLLRKVANDPNAIGMVMPLQPTQPYITASMEDVFSAAKSYGFDTGAFVLRPPYKNKWHAHHSKPTKAIARLKSAEIPVRTLNAKHFPQDNARIVRDWI